MNEITIEHINHLLNTLDAGLILLACIAGALWFMFIKSVYND